MKFRNLTLVLALSIASVSNVLAQSRLLRDQICKPNMSTADCLNEVKIKFNQARAPQWKDLATLTKGRCYASQEIAQLFSELANLKLAGLLAYYPEGDSKRATLFFAPPETYFDGRTDLVTVTTRAVKKYNRTLIRLNDRLELKYTRERQNKAEVIQIKKWRNALLATLAFEDSPNETLLACVLEEVVPVKSVKSRN